MIVLLSKELRYILSSASGFIFIIIFLLLSGSLLWLFPGSYNIPEGGYATMSSFFFIAPVLLMLLIPALSMRSFSEEKRLNTIVLLYTRPVHSASIILAKNLAIYITVLIAIFPTMVYVLCLYFLGNPVGNIDINATLGSYLSLLVIALGFVFISVFSSSLTSNQITAFVISLLLCFGLFYGFDLLSNLFSSGKTQVFIKGLGFLSHYQSVQHGMFNSNDFFYTIFILFLFFALTILSLKRIRKKKVISYFIMSIVFLFLSFGDFFRIDFTKDKKYTPKLSTEKLLKSINKPIEVDVFLEGDLNSGFFRLQQAVLIWLNDFSRISSGKIKINRIDPELLKDNEYLQKLSAKGITGLAVNDKDVNGKIFQQIIYPWIIFRTGDKEIPFYLLSDEPGKTGYEKLNSSIEKLEYRFVQIIQTLVGDKTKKIAFLYGHLELNDILVGDIWDKLSNSYQIDAGTLSAVYGELDNYELVIIAGPRTNFTEREKYILDQYLMNGGRLLILLNGVTLNAEMLIEKGETPSMANEVNLEDMLFTYGIRIDPVLIQDVQCVNIPVGRSSALDDSDFIFLPWYFAPLLTPSSEHIITKDIPVVKTQYASSLSFVGGNDDIINKTVLLSTSRRTHIVRVPEMISLNELERKPDDNYFNESYLPVAALLEGNFMSVFKNRLMPDSIDMGNNTFIPSGESKIIVIASEEIIQNDTYETGEAIKYFPLGFDRYSQVQYGNSNFLLNAVNYLTGDEELIALRSKNFQLELLNQSKYYENRILYLIINLLLPVLLIAFLFFVFSKYRRNKYGRKINN